MNPTQHLEFLQNPPRWLVPAALGLALIVGLISGLVGRTQAPVEYQSALLVLALLAALVNALMALFLFPLIFTALSRRFGAPTDFVDIRTISAVCLVATLAALLLATLTHATLLSVLGGLVSTCIFVYGLSLANGTDLISALRHTAAIWGLLIAILIGLRVIVSLF